MKIDDLRGRRVAIWGFGREGRSTLAFLRREAPDLDLTVLNDAPLPKEDQPQGVELIIDAANVLDRFDVIVKSPGISLYRLEIARAQERGTHFTSATNLWFAHEAARRGGRTVAVTGTKGKSTTAALLAHLLRAHGKAVELRGNIGNPLLDPAPDPVDVWVIEMSSYQIADLEAAVDVALLLNLYPEHLDWHGDEDTYFRDKTRLLTRQAAHDHGTAVLDASFADDPRLQGKIRAPRYFNQHTGYRFDNESLWRGGACLADLTDLPLRGEHNFSNLCAALTALDALGIRPKLEALSDFHGLPHRLQDLGEYDGRLWVDDSISTTPQSTRAAIESFPDRPITLLLGGYDRGINYTELARFLAGRPDVLSVTLGASGPRIASALRKEGARVRESENLEQAVAAAREDTPKGGVVLLSPAAPSYDQFTNFEERGDAFCRLAETRAKN